MTPELVQQWAREAGVEPSNLARWGGDEMYVFNVDELQRFATLACAWQAEQDAKLCEQLKHNRLSNIQDLCAAAIRASVKGQQ